MAVKGVNMDEGNGLQTEASGHVDTKVKEADIDKNMVLLTLSDSTRNVVNFFHGVIRAKEEDGFGVIRLGLTNMRISDLEIETNQKVTNRMVFM